jgi:ferredoxin
MLNASSMLTLLEKLQSQNLTIHQNRCAVVRNRHAQCTRCVDACTTGCLSIHEGEISITPEKCIGCGTCATMCPTCAIEAHKPSDAEIYEESMTATEAAEGEAIIACEQILAAAQGLYDPQKVTSVKCLGRVDESLIAMLVCNDATRVTLVKAKCEECSYATGLHTAEAVCETANTLLETWNSPVRARVASKFPSAARLVGESEYDASKREFFTSIKDEVKSAAVITVDQTAHDVLGEEDVEPPKYVKVGEDGTLPHSIPGRRKRLLTALKAMGEPQDIMIGTRLWGHVVIETDKCTSCQMCATFCPTGALKKFEKKDGTFGVDHYPSLCVKCRTCTDICPPDALWISEEVFAVDLQNNAHERYVMKPRERELNDPHKMWHTMRDLLGCDQIFER